MKREFIKNHKYLIVAIIFGLSLFLPFVFFNDSLYIFDGDFLEQLVPIYTEGWRRLREGEALFWDWSNFLGANYYGSDLYYCFGSPFFWLSMLVPSVNLIPKTFVYTYMLKTVLCIVFAYMWLYKISKSDLASSIGSLIVSFSGFVLANVSNGFMYDGIVFCGLILYFVECYLSERKTTGLALSIGLLGIVNYYLLYIFVPFSCIYTLMRYISIEEELTVKKTVSDGFRFLCFVILGIMVSAAVLLPAVYALKGTPKTDELILGLESVGKHNYYRFITSFFTPTSDWRQNFNFFISTDLEGVGISHSGGFSNYCLIISVFSLMPLLTIEDKKTKYSALTVVILYCILSYFKVFYILFNRNYATRWMMIFAYLMAYIVVTVISRRGEITKKTFVISSLVCIAALVFFTFFSVHKGYTFYFWEITALKRNAAVISAFLIVLALAFCYDLKTVMVVVVLLDVCFSYYNLYTNINENLPFTKEQYFKTADYHSGAVKMIMENDDSFYRIDQSFIEDYSLNRSLNYGYRSFVGYHSVLNYNGLDFMNGRFTSDGHCVITAQNGKDILKTMLGSKYWYVYEPVIFDSGYGEFESTPPYGYSFYGESEDGGHVYINDHYLTFGYLRNKTINKADFDGFDTLIQDYLLLDHVCVEDVKTDDTDVMADLELINKREYLDIDKDCGILYVNAGKENLTDSSWSFYDANDNGLTYGYLPYFSYMGLNVPEGASYFTYRKNKDLEIYYDDMSWFEGWYSCQKMVDPESVRYDNNSISGVISADERSWFVTYVPYDGGWKVKVDGQKVEYKKVNNGFIGFEIDAGDHLIEMDYTVPGLAAGGVLSLLSIVAIAITIRCKKAPE